MPLFGQHLFGEQLFGKNIAPWRKGVNKKALQDPDRTRSSRRITLGAEVHGSLRGTYATNYTRQTYGSGPCGRRTNAELTFHVQKGVQLRTKYHKPSGEVPAQLQAMWPIIRTAITNWQGFTESQKKPYRDREISGKGGSGYNIYLSEYLEANAP